MRALLTIALFVVSMQAFPTSQVSDILVYNGDTVSIFSTPLEYRSDIDSLRLRLFDYKDTSISSDCWRRYIAYWLIQNDSLFLTKIISCQDTKLEASLDKLFPDELSAGKIFATWFSGELDIPSGKLLEYVHMGFESIYETEEVIEIKEGIYQSTTVFKNIVRMSEFWEMAPNKLQQNIYSNINWSVIPDIADRHIQTYITFQTDPTFVIDTAYSYTMIDGEMDTNLNNPFMKETIRIAKEIPSWNYFKRKGVRLNNSFSLLFSNDNKNKYMR